MTHIVDLPSEILVLIGDYLDKTDIFNLIVTSRVLHQQFVGRLWKTLLLAPGELLPAVGTLEAHVHGVRNLEYSGRLPSEYYGIVFPVLTTLKLNTYPAIIKGRTPTLEQDSNWARLVRLNPTIQDLVLNIRHGLELLEFWGAVGTSLHNPRWLQIGGGGMRGSTRDGKELFWRACSRFEEIEYVGMDQLQTPLTTTQDFSRIKHLSYFPTNTKSSRPENHLALFGHCNNLRKLGWGSTSRKFPLDRLVRCLQQSAWLLLEDVNLGGVAASDEDLATLIRLLSPMRRFRLGSGDFGPLCFDHLHERHFDSLRALDLVGCATFTSRMALDVLLSCSQLEEVKARCIALRDLQSTPQPWVCLGLRSLTVFFASDSYNPANDSLVFDQLSRLKHLESLDVSLYNGNSSRQRVPVERALQWRLDSGLSRLSTLTKLRSVDFRGSRQDLRPEEIRWMLGNWPALERILGQLSVNPTTEMYWFALMEQQGIFRR